MGAGGNVMSKVKLTVSLDEELVDYLRKEPNVSAVVSEAVAEYRARKLENRLEQAYRDDAGESERLNREWEGADADVDE